MIDTLLFSPLLTPAEMNGWDRACADMGLTTDILMENASREALHALEDRLGPLRGKTALCLAGPGNNGGDAVALARHLHDVGVETMLLLARPARDYKGAPGFHLRLAKRAGVPVGQLPRSGSKGFPGPDDAPDIVVDGLLGTGLTGDPRPDYADWIDEVNRLGECSFVLALDIPSGLSGLTGTPSKHTVIADLTVSFETAKLGLSMPQASPYVGELDVRSIGIPRSIREARPASHFLLGPEMALLLPGLAPDMHKGTAGRLLVIGGSPGLTGAPLLAGLGALRAGGGLVTVACPRDLEPVLKSGYPDVMTLPLGRGEKWDPAMARTIRERLGLYDALVVGPGMGRGEDAAAFLAELTAVLDGREGGRLPLVWDADALFWLADHPRRLGSAVITPHPGEAARLLGRSIAEVEADRLGSARELSRRFDAVAVLKGAGTVVCGGADEASPVFLSPFAEPNLAVGGSGDVLAGVAGRLLSCGLSPLLAACLGVYWHGLAGRLVSGDFPYRGNLATEIAQALPRALTEWIDAES